MGKLEKISAWNLTKVRSKKRGDRWSKDDRCQSSFCITDGHMSFEKFKGRVVLRGDIAKDDSGSSAVFAEQGSSASQMTVAKVMDIIARLLGCDGQAADAVSAFSQVKMEDAHKLLTIPKSECPDIWIRLPRHKWPTHGLVSKTQLYFLQGICTVILWKDYCGRGNLRKSYWNMAGRKFQIGNVSLHIVKKDYSYLCMRMTHCWLERNTILIRCGKYSIKKSIWENQRLFLIIYTWAALNVNAK